MTHFGEAAVYAYAEYCTPGCVRRAPGNRRPYVDKWDYGLRATDCGTTGLRTTDRGWLIVWAVQYNLWAKMVLQHVRSALPQGDTMARIPASHEKR